MQPPDFTCSTRSGFPHRRSSLDRRLVLSSLPAMSQVTFESWLATAHPHISVASMGAVLRLAGEGATVPFIARYRKEQTGALDEVAIRTVIDGKESWDSIVKRQAFIVEEIERQGKLTDGCERNCLAPTTWWRWKTCICRTSRSARPRPSSRARRDWNHWPTGCGTAATAWRHLPLAKHRMAAPAPSSMPRRRCPTPTRPWPARLNHHRAAIRNCRSARHHAHALHGRWLRQNEERREGQASEQVRKLLQLRRASARPHQAGEFDRYLAMRRGWMEEELVLHGRSHAARAGRARGQAARGRAGGCAGGGSAAHVRGCGVLEARLRGRAHLEKGGALRPARARGAGHRKRSAQGAARGRGCSRDSGVCRKCPQAAFVRALRTQGGAGRGSRPAHWLQAGGGRRFGQIRGQHGHAPGNAGRKIRR